MPSSMLLADLYTHVMSLIYVDRSSGIVSMGSGAISDDHRRIAWYLSLSCAKAGGGLDKALTELGGGWLGL